MEKKLSFCSIHKWSSERTNCINNQCKWRGYMYCNPYKNDLLNWPKISITIKSHLNNPYIHVYSKSYLQIFNLLTPHRSPEHTQPLTAWGNPIRSCTMLGHAFHLTTQIMTYVTHITPKENIRIRCRINFFKGICIQRLMQCTVICALLCYQIPIF